MEWLNGRNMMDKFGLKDTWGSMWVDLEGISWCNHILWMIQVIDKLYHHPGRIVKVPHISVMKTWVPPSGKDWGPCQGYRKHRIGIINSSEGHMTNYRHEAGHRCECSCPVLLRITRLWKHTAGQSAENKSVYGVLGHKETSTSDLPFPRIRKYLGRGGWKVVRARLYEIPGKNSIICTWQGGCTHELIVSVVAWTRQVQIQGSQHPSLESWRGSQGPTPSGGAICWQRFLSCPVLQPFSPKETQRDIR